MRLLSCATRSSSTTGARAHSAMDARSAADSSPSSNRAKSLMPSGSTAARSLPAALYSAMVTMATAPLMAFFLSSATGAKSPTSPSCSRLIAIIVAASEASGSSFRMIESEVAMSLKGRPSTNFAPKSAYSLSGFAKAWRSTTLSTLPSLCSALLTSYGLDSSSAAGSTPLRFSNDLKSLSVSWKGASVPMPLSLASVPISASREHGSISNSGSSVSDTRIVSPNPSSRSAPMPMALFMRPSSPSPASVTPRCSG
mmetsp:Transcript_13250/g.28004  ORF Transcript_13250/g.28004 Transcript_13250/m.28004 type:complete len:255 (-) Transcript_13250:676-1440(-)